MKREGSRPVHPGDPGGCDTRLLQIELAWITAATLAGAAAGGVAAGADGAAIGACAALLIQQWAYHVLVRHLWRGWRNHFLGFIAANEQGGARAGPGTTDETLDRGPCARAFALWMRTAGLKSQLYVLLWTRPDEMKQAGLFGEDIHDPSEQHSPSAELVEARKILFAYKRALALGNQPLRCDDAARRRLRHTLQRDERRLLDIALN